MHSDDDVEAEVKTETTNACCVPHRLLVCSPAKPENYWPGENLFRVVAVVAEFEADGPVVKVHDKSKSRGDGCDGKFFFGKFLPNCCFLAKISARLHRHDI